MTERRASNGVARDPRSRMKYCNRARRKLRDSGRRDVFWEDEEDIPLSGESEDEESLYSSDDYAEDEQEETIQEGRLAKVRAYGDKVRELKNVKIPLPNLEKFKRENPNCKLDVFPTWLGNPVRDGRLLVDKHVNLDHFGEIKFLCEGETSVVSVARYDSNKRYYCLKGIKKKWVFKTRSFDEVERQLAVHISTSSRFIANVFRVFDHPSFVFVMQEYCLGGTLAMAIEKRALPPFTAGKLSLKEARFYLAEIASALHYLHSVRNIVYRGLLLENVGISWNGHVKLLGFGRAIQTDPKSRYIKTSDRDVYGNIDMLAPELVPPRLSDPFASLMAKMRAKEERRYQELDREAQAYHQSNGSEEYSDQDDEEHMYNENDGLFEPEEDDLHLYHSYESDWWSFGAIMYRMLNGFKPFGDSNVVPDSDVARRILFNAPIPAFWRTKRKERRLAREGITEMLDGLLVLNQSRRWGFQEITDSVFFQGFVDDWMLVHNLKPPFVPPLGQVEADSSAYAHSQRARKKEMKIGVYPEELRVKPSKHEISYNHFSGVCRDVMREQLSKHTLQSRQQVEQQMKSSPSSRNVRQDLSESRMFLKLQKGYAKLEEKRKYQREVHRQNRKK